MNRNVFIWKNYIDKIKLSDILNANKQKRENRKLSMQFIFFVTLVVTKTNWYEGKHSQTNNQKSFIRTTIESSRKVQIFAGFLQLYFQKYKKFFIGTKEMHTHIENVYFTLIICQTFL